jgi:hypothetical protein
VEYHLSACAGEVENLAIVIVTITLTGRLCSTACISSLSCLRAVGRHVGAAIHDVAVKSKVKPLTGRRQRRLIRDGSR